MSSDDSKRRFTLFSRKAQTPSLDGMGLDALLFEARTSQDPVRVHAALIKAEALAPDSLTVQRALLLHGRLHERSARQMDFSVIKCYLLHSFEHPEQHREPELNAMARELFDDARLKRCLELAPDREAFLREYLEALSQEYLRIFVAADNSHIPRVFGISFKGSLQKYLAVPARDIITNILSSPFLGEAEARLLARAFYRAYFTYAAGDVGGLDHLLGAEVCALMQ